MPDLLNGARRTTLPVPRYVRRLPLHRKVHAFVEAAIFRWMIYVAIIANAIFLGVEVENADDTSFTGRVCKNVDLFLTFFFTVESVLKFYSYGHEYITHHMFLVYGISLRSAQRF